MQFPVASRRLAKVKGPAGCQASKPQYSQGPKLESQILLCEHDTYNKGVFWPRQIYQAQHSVKAFKLIIFIS